MLNEIQTHFQKVDGVALIGIVHGRLENRRSLVRISGSVNILSDSHCDWIHSSLTAVHSFHDCYVGKELLGKTIVWSTHQ